MPHTYIPIAVTSNLWIIPSNPQTLGSTVAIIFLDKATSTEPLQQPFHILRLSFACNATSRYFHLPPHYEDHSMVMNVSLDITTINANNISAQTLEYGNILAAIGPPNLQKLANVPEVPIAQPYRDMSNTSEPIYSFTIKDYDDEDPSLVWTILKHPGTYVGTIGMIFVVCIGVYCFKRLLDQACHP